MNEFFYEGVWRMDWGMGNPNKTAALIAMLMIVVWLLVFVRRWGFWVALTLFTGLGICLVHTFSRGGLLALGVGLLPLLWIGFRSRPWPKSRLIGLGLSVWVIIGASVYLQAHQRYTQGIAQEDRSITNRLVIWKTAPQMIQDAPAGWGIGNSGKAYMEWYQPLERHEGYRTLVNSHLTWLVEFGWPLRLLYLFAWGAVLILCWPGDKNRWMGVAWGVWASLGVAAVFSSVAEEIWLWVLPALLLIAVLVVRALRRDWPALRSWLLPTGVTASIALALLIWPGDDDALPIRAGQGRVAVGEGKPTTWVVLNPRVFGNSPGRTFRRLVEDEGIPASAVGFSDSARSLPHHNGERVILGGAVDSADLESLAAKLAPTSEVILVNPAFHPMELFPADADKQKIQVLFGSFTQSGNRFVWEQFLEGRPGLLEGTGDYYAAWTDLVAPQSKTTPEEEL